jgi:hypothetical protein
MNLKVILSTIRRHHSFLIIPLLVWLFYTIIGLAERGSNLFVLSIAVVIATGFLLTIFPRCSHIGSIIMSIMIVLLMLMYVINIYMDLPLVFLFLLSFAISCCSVLPLHIVSRTRSVFPSFGRVFFPIIAYIFTTLFLFYVEGTMAGTNPWLIFSSLISVVIMVLIPLNITFREGRLIKLIDISDVDLYYKISEDLKKTFKNQFSSEIEKVVSELKNAVYSFIYESFEVSIINCHNVLEGLNRILKWTKKGEISNFLNKEKIESLKQWRQDIAHSNVSKSTKNNEDEETPNNCSKYQKAFNSIGFVIELLNRLTDQRS